MNKVWTSDDLRTFRTELLATRDLREVAVVLEQRGDAVGETTGAGVHGAPGRRSEVSDGELDQPSSFSMD